MAVIVAVISAIGAGLNLSAQHPATGETIEVRNLLSADGIRWIYTNVEHNFVKFPMAGFAAAFCGVSAGFESNFIIGSVDPILAGLSTSAAQIKE